MKTLVEYHCSYVCLAVSYHLLESIKRRCQQQGIIRISKNSEVGSTDPAATPVLPEDGEQIVHVETVRESAQDRALPNSICHTKARGEFIIPSDIGKLVDVDEYQ